MKISGTATLTAPPERVWEAFHDPAALARCLPGCESLTELGEHRYAMTLNAGVAAVKGRYDGQVHLTNQQHPQAFTLKARGAGAPGTVDADVRVRLSPDGNGGTALSYDADAAVGGAIGGVGQRMLAGVTRKMADQFFTAVDEHLGGGAPTAVAREGALPTGPGAPTEPGAVPVAAPSTVPSTTYAGRPGRVGGAGLRDRSFAAGVGLGAVVALVGVVVGAAIGRRR